MIKRIIIAVVLIASIAFGYQFVDSQFRLSNIHFDELQKNEQPLEISEKQILQKIFDQPFTYLDRGKQSYVFISKDGKYILKFFDANKLRPSLFSDEQSLERKHNRLFEGYRLAYVQDRENSGIIFLQLNPSSLDLQANVIDRFGFSHQIPLNEVPFVIQIKAIPTRIVISRYLEKGDLEGAKNALRQLLEMHLDEYHRGIHDLDHNFMYNTGFVDGHPIRIDAGRLKEDAEFMNPDVYNEDLKKIFLDRVQGWMQRHFPRYQKEILDDMQQQLSGIKAIR